MERAQQRTRRLKWQSPPPKILHLPRRPRKKQASSAAVVTGLQSENKERLAVLLEQERVFFKERSKEEIRENEEESWKFQAEMLRAECDLLMMEREIAVRKMERKKLQLKRTLSSTLHILISVRRKISEGKDVSLMVGEEIDQLMEKLKMSSFKPGPVNEADFDKQVSSIKKKNKDEHKCPGMLEIREIAVQSFCARDSSNNQEEGMLDNWKCSGHCESIVQKIVEQVRVEIEQWSQMQGMLRQVRDEMDELQTSRDFWEDQALNKDYEIQSLHLMVTEWRQKALCSKLKVNELQEQISKLQEEMKKRSMKKKKDREASQNQGAVEDEIKEKQVVVLTKEKSCRENYNCRPPTLDDLKTVNSKRQPLADIGNERNFPLGGYSSILHMCRDDNGWSHHY